jgi:hypothetical protein
VYGAITTKCYKVLGGGFGVGVFEVGNVKLNNNLVRKGDKELN